MSEVEPPGGVWSSHLPGTEGEAEGDALGGSDALGSATSSPSDSPDSSDCPDSPDSSDCQDSPASSICPDPIETDAYGAAGDAAADAAGGMRIGRLRAWVASPDGRAIAVLVVLPMLFFALPAALGHPALTGDNLIQNFPLRVLTGRQLAEGHLPLWNPYIWSGAPLLGGLNSGSFYPFTFCFVVLAPVAAFVVNLLGVYWAGGLGMYALARQYGLRPVASFVGAISYAFGGAMVGQMEHLGVVQGMGWMPLLVLAMLRLSWVVLGTGPVTRRAAGAGVGAPVTGDPSTGGPTGALGGHSTHPQGARAGTSPWAWVALLALTVGLEALTGEPRAMAETELVGSVVALWLVLRPYAGTVVTRVKRLTFFGLLALAGAWGVALAAAELAPGWSFITASQRAVENYQFFGSGSLRVSWSLLLLVPDLFGGAGRFGSVFFFNNYSLQEVTGYVGLLPLGAALALLARSFGRRRDRGASDWGMWLVLGGLGLLLAWGSFTPLGHIWAAIPLFGRTRLQSRNLEIVDLALGLLLAFWADRALSARRVVGSDHERLGRAWRRWLPAVPALAAVAVCVVTLAAPGPVEEWLKATSGGAALARRLWPWFLAQSMIAAAVVALVVLWRRLGDVARRRALVSVVVVDLAFFAFAASTALGPPVATREPTHAEATAVMGTDGRYAFVDTSVSDLYTLSEIGLPDLNVFAKVPSVQGYGSIVSGTYGAATGTHTLATLSACALEGGTFDQLRLSTLVVFTGNLAVPTGQPAFSHPPAPTPCAGPIAAATRRAGRRTFYLGRPLVLSSATLATIPGARESSSPTLGVLTSPGTTRWPAEAVRRTTTGWSVTFRRPQRAEGIVVAGPASAVADTSTVQGADGGSWRLDGSMQDAIEVPTWRFSGNWGGVFAIFRRTAPVRPAAWLAHRAAGSSVRQLEAPDWGGATDHVVASAPVTVVWSEAYMPGWHASLTPAGPSDAPSGANARASAVTRGSPVALPPQLDLPVRKYGLIQAVRVPAGNWILTFTYRPRLLTLGLAGSAAAVLGFAVLFWATVERRRHKRRRWRRYGHRHGHRLLQDRRAAGDRGERLRGRADALQGADGASR